MKTKSFLTSKSDEDKSSFVITDQFQAAWRYPVQMGMLLFLVLLGASQVWAQPYSIWNDTTVPAIPADADPTAVEVGLRFRSSVNGSIIGIRFYKGEGNTGTHIGDLWTSSGTLLASVEFINETASGWQQQGLAAVPIESNTTYIVSYYAPNGMYAFDGGYFASAGVDNYPLRALADGEDGPNGVYAYGPAGTFPNQTYNANNYWVDVVFEPEDSGCAGDTTPPVITAPHNVIMDCGDCNTDPSNTGTATATDDCTVTITYNDAVSGDCPKVVKRTWTATDEAGNASSAVQTITCLPSNLVTTGSGCIFDRDPSTPVQDFRLIFIQDPQNWPCYKLAASNPGQLFYNVFYTGTPGQQVTLNVSVPYPFVTQGANPIHAYDWVTVMGGGDQPCLSPGNEFFVSSQQIRLGDFVQNVRGNKLTLASRTIPVTLTVPASGVVYLAVHLDYGLKGLSGYTKDLLDNARDCSTGALLIPNDGSYNFSVDGDQNGDTSIQNNNSFKRIPGVAGLVVYEGTGDPVPGTLVSLQNANGVAVGAGVADDDGFYMIVYKHTGKAATYKVSILAPGGYTETKSIKLKANAFVRVDFTVPTDP